MQLQGSLLHDPLKDHIQKLPSLHSPLSLSVNKKKGFNFKSSSRVLFSVLSISTPCSNCMPFLLHSPLPFLPPLTSLLPCNKLGLALPSPWVSMNNQSNPGPRSSRSSSAGMGNGVAMGTLLLSATTLHRAPSLVMVHRLTGLPRPGSLSQQCVADGRH